MKKPPMLLVLATICVWSAVILTGLNRFKLNAHGTIGILLVTKPNVVKLSIDGEKFESGAWIETPYKLVLTPGRHRIKIGREGFVAHLITVEGDSGDNFKMEDVVLAKIKEANFTTVEVQSDDDGVHIDLDDGLAHGETPYVFQDVEASSVHTLTAYPKWPDKDGKVRCKLPPSSDPGPAKLRLKMHGNKLRWSNCDSARSATN